MHSVPVDSMGAIASAIVNATRLETASSSQSGGYQARLTSPMSASPYDIQSAQSSNANSSANPTVPERDGIEYGTRAGDWQVYHVKFGKSLMDWEVDGPYGMRNSSLPEIPSNLTGDSQSILVEGRVSNRLSEPIGREWFESTLPTSVSLRDLDVSVPEQGLEGQMFLNSTVLEWNSQSPQMFEFSINSDERDVSVEP